MYSWLVYSPEWCVTDTNPLDSDMPSEQSPCCCCAEVSVPVFGFTYLFPFLQGGPWLRIWTGKLSEARWGEPACFPCDMLVGSTCAGSGCWSTLLSLLLSLWLWWPHQGFQLENKKQNWSNNKTPRNIGRVTRTQWYRGTSIPPSHTQPLSLVMSWALMFGGSCRCLHLRASCFTSARHQPVQQHSRVPVTRPCSSQATRSQQVSPYSRDNTWAQGGYLSAQLH